ncbi:alpha/beta fold hydrolase [Lutimaribacter saemankumensis]|uniref:Pimeloyl-ACP methyl ester carboxylesterase n=1 Tax=Lutimaribacter saemankumensis TaxID=490829 RepID=A0A1G8TGX3_9RHOB|nr:alpha/beta fold hydrolase [Lutimaribacter saemankumensis]SDJ39930.1 Pimeloyl-ACP methyl ester carboxylesterase [Lutimaribacter saemankumensis]
METEPGRNKSKVDTDDLFGEVVQLTYATVAQPEKFHELIMLWEKCLTSRIVSKDQDTEDAALVGHFNQALQIFDHIGRVQRDHDRAKRILDGFSMPAFICDAALNILYKNEEFDGFAAVNEVRGPTFGEAIREQIRNWEVGQTVAFVPDLAEPDGAGAAVITELPQGFYDDTIPGKQYLVVFNEVSETNVAWGAIRDKYNLTAAEADVLAQLAKGRKADEIALQKGVSVNTIRAQIRALLEKTGSRNQNDLVRSSVFVLSQFQSLKLVAQAFVPSDARPEAVFSRVILPSGRMLQFRQFGDMDGLPVLYLHGMMGGPDLPHHVKTAARQSGLRIIAPSRPGFGKSDSIPATDWEFVRQSCRDLYAFLDVLSVPAAFVIGNLSGFGIAINFANRFPEKCIGVLNAGYSGIVSDDLIDGMGTMSRAFARSYQKSRTALRFLTRAAIASVDFLGAHRMMQRHLGASPVDLDYCHEVGCFDMMADGLTHAIAQGGEAFIKDGFLATKDWRDVIEEVAGKVRLHCILGERDGIAPHLRIKHEAEQIAGYDVRFFPDAGQLVLFQEWEAVQALIHEDFAKNRGRLSKM